MYRVVTVDDEMWSLIGFRKMAEQEAGSFTIEDEFTDSREALEAILRDRPDVVFVDIRMPELSGLELMHQVREHHVLTRFVVLSGYSEFSYAQTALREGAFDYLLKPLSQEVLHNEFTRLKAALDQDRERQLQWILWKIEDNRGITAEERNVLLGEAARKPFLVVAILDFSTEAENGNTAGNDLPESAVCTVRIGPHRFACFFSGDKDPFRRVQQELEQLPAGAKAGLSAAGNPDSLPVLVRQAQESLQETFLYPEEKVLAPASSDKTCVNEMAGQIQECYYAGNTEKVRMILQSAPDVFRRRRMGLRDASYLWNRLAPIAAHKEKDSDTAGYITVDEMTERYENLDEMCAFVAEELAPEEKEQSGAANDKFQMMLQYIDENYMHTLVLKDLCSQFYINISYCCELFQRYKNTSFSRYVTGLRIQRARELLENGFSVNDTCDLVGYQDYFYFNRVFKKETGTTPAEYRKSSHVQ